MKNSTRNITAIARKSALLWESNILLCYQKRRLLLGVICRLQKTFLVILFFLIDFNRSLKTFHFLCIFILNSFFPCCQGYQRPSHYIATQGKKKQHCYLQASVQNNLQMVSEPLMHDVFEFRSCSRDRL